MPARQIIEAETPKGFLRQASGPVKDMLELGWKAEGVFCGMQRFGSPDFYVYGVHKQNSLVMIFTISGGGAVTNLHLRGSPRSFMNHEIKVGAAKWAEIIPVIRSFWSSLKTTLPEDESALPTWPQYYRNWIAMASQLRARELTQ